MVARDTTVDWISWVILHLPSFVDVKSAGLMAKTFRIWQYAGRFQGRTHDVSKKL